jgi:hypothetical protein
MLIWYHVTELKFNIKIRIWYQDLLDIYKLDIGKLRFFKKLVNVEELIKMVEYDLRVLTSDKKIDLIYDLRINKRGNILYDSKKNRAGILEPGQKFNRICSKGFWQVNN